MDHSGKPRLLLNSSRSIHCQRAFFFLFICNIRCTRPVEGNAGPAIGLSCPLVMDFQSFHSLWPGEQPPTCVWGRWQVLGLYLELYNKVKLSDLDGVWNHDLGPMLHYNQLS